MTDLFRFGISLEKTLLDEFDRLIKIKNYPNRSEAFRDVVAKKKGGMVRKKMASGGAVRGAGCATKGKGKMRMY